MQDDYDIPLSTRYPEVTTWRYEALKALRVGSVLLRIQMVAPALLAVTGLSLFWLTRSSNAAPDPAIFLGLMVATFVLQALAAILVFAATWKLSEPLTDGEIGHDDAPRRTARILAFVFVGAFMLSSVVGFVMLLLNGAPALGSGQRPPPDPLSIAAGCTNLIVLMTWHGVLAWHLESIADALGADSLERRAKTYIWLGPVLVSVGGLACGLGPLVAYILLFGMMIQVSGAAKKWMDAIEAPNPFAA
ncbi:MAG: hypothetical protein AAF297_05165 [Planctomycetota bacterium]